MVSPLRFGIIGTGSIARSYESAFAGLPDAMIACGCDVDASNRATFGKRVGCNSYATPEDLFAAEDLDGVVVCTPPSTHEPIATFFLNHGVPVLCEKPLSTSVASAKRMLAAAQRNDVLFTMAAKFRYVDDVRKAKALVDAGTIGEVVLIENSFTSWVDMKGRWNCDTAISGGGVLIDNGTHAVDILRYMLGSLCDIQIVEGRRIQDLPVEDTVRLFVRSRKGIIGTSDLSWSINKETDTYLQIYGSEGTILVGWKLSRYRRFDNDEWNVFGQGYDKVAAFRNQIANFCDAIRGRDVLHITPFDALASVEVVAAGYTALHRARWQTVRRYAERAGEPLPAYSRELEAV
ncbi:MAG: Gfo/Idh/MocA family protein [Vulcanimicrobiaceae bacterium]